MNNTTAGIIRRLPNRDILSMRDIADACGFVTTTSIRNAILDGRLQATKIGGSLRVVREEAIRFLNASELEALK